MPLPKWAWGGWRKVQLKQGKMHMLCLARLRNETNASWAVVKIKHHPPRADTRHVRVHWKVLFVQRQQHEAGGALAAKAACSERNTDKQLAISTSKLNVRLNRTLRVEDCFYVCSISGTAWLHKRLFDSQAVPNADLKWQPKCRVASLISKQPLRRCMVQRPAPRFMR